MADEIETLDELVERAELREVVIHEVGAERVTGPDPEAIDLPPEQLHAPGSPDDFAALDIATRLSDDQIGVRCRIDTRNAYGSFHADAEVVFGLPVPVAEQSCNDIMGPFVELIGLQAVFPYIRAAVASLAAQLSVAASPMPFLRPGDVALSSAEPPAEQEVPEGLLAMGTVQVTNDDGSVTQVAEFFVDAATGELVRLGDADGDAHELLDMMARLAPAFAGPNAVEGAEGVDWEWVIHQRGEQAARELAEELRMSCGDAAADEWTAEIDRIVNEAALETSAASLGEALEALHTAIASTREVVNLPETTDGDNERGALTTLLAAAEKVMAELDEFRTAAS